MEREFWQAFMHKAAQKQEYRWEDFRKDEPIPMEYDAVKDFDSRFFYYDSYSIVASYLFHSTNRSTEEDKFEEWAIEEEDLEPGLAMDPKSYAAKALQRKRKDPPTEEDPLPPVRKRPATPPTEGADPPLATRAVQQTGTREETVVAADGTARAVSTLSVTTPASGPSDRMEEAQQMDVSAKSRQVQSVGTISQPSAQQQTSPSDNPSLEESQAQSAQSSTGVRQQSPALATADEMQDQQILRQERLEIYSQLMIDSMYEAQPRLVSGHDVINKAVHKAGVYVSI